MVYNMPKIGRTVELDDWLVDAYLKTIEPSILTESLFIMALKADYGHYPTEEEMPQNELSDYCNNILLQELEFSVALPKITDFLSSGGEGMLRDAALSKMSDSYKI